MADLDKTIKCLEHCYKGKCVYANGERCPYLNISGCTKAMLSNALELLKEKQPKKGKWIETEVRGSRALCCSECGCDTGTIYDYPFCPNCGADMRKDGEQE